MRLSLIAALTFIATLWMGFNNPCDAATICFQCHEKNNFINKIIHEPVAQGECTLCHNPHVAKYKGLLQEKVVDLCATCHENIIASTGIGFVHSPVKKGECLACHNPHAATNPGLINESHGGDNCFTCHASLKKNYEHSHAPFAKGECTVCHNPHQSKYPLLLNEEKDDLCRKCHAENDLVPAHKGFPGKIGQCLTCHNPHGSNRPRLVRENLHPPYEEGCSTCHEGTALPGTSVCLSCHEEISKQLYTLHNHLALDKENSCVVCHSPHASDQKGLLKNRQVQICRKCHQDTFEGYLDKLYSHPDTGACSDCHAVHGSNELVMLYGNGNEVCAKCHESQGQFTHPVGDKVKDPRNDQTLTCVSCHYPHGTDFKYNLKLSGSEDLCVQCHRSY